MRRRELLAAWGAHAASNATVDLCIYGATPGGIAAAVAAGRQGRRVVLCALEDHIGGIVSNGLTNADIGKRQAVGGLFFEFTQRVLAYYRRMDEGNPAQPNVKLCRDGYWYEANGAEKIFHEMLASAGGHVQLRLRHELVKATVERGRLTAITLRDGEATSEVRARVFVDATYEGDLAAMAGAPFRTGREARAEYGEPHAGKIYMRFRETQPLPGSTGEGDEAVQGYCFRFHVTNLPEKRVPIAQPAGYQRSDYTAVLEDIRAGRAKKFRDVIQVYPMPNGRFELNSDHPHPDTGTPSESLDFTEENWSWPTATPAERQKLYRRILTHNAGLIWLLQNDAEVPETIRADARQWGWHRDEWPQNGHQPRQVYVRQGRRIVGEATLTEHDAKVDPATKRTALRTDSIGVIEWAFDPHGHHKYDPAHPGVREGYFFVDHEPFQVPYGVLVPKKVDALLVPVACSCSHVAYNAVRMEPVFMALGEACGLAAHVALARGVDVRRVPVPSVQKLLVERRGVITFLQDVPFTSATFAALQYLGARGWNQGYTLSPVAKLTREAAWARLGRVLAAAAPVDRPTEPLRAKEAAQLLRRSGLRVSTPREDADLTEDSWAAMVYRALAPQG